MDPVTLSHSPFTALTFIATPALLTNTSSGLAASTISRLLSVRDAMERLVKESEELRFQEDHILNVAQVNRFETQAKLLVSSLNTIYVSIGSFSGATLTTLIGEALFQMLGPSWYNRLALLGIGLGALGVGCLLVGSLKLFQATKLSLVTINEEGGLMRTRYMNNKGHASEAYGNSRAN